MRNSVNYADFFFFLSHFRCSFSRSLTCCFSRQRELLLALHSHLASCRLLLLLLSSSSSPLAASSFFL